MKLISSARLPVAIRETGNLTGRSPCFQSKNQLFQTQALLAGALPLLVAAILADNPHHTIAADDFAVAANALNGSTYFHCFTYIQQFSQAYRSKPERPWLLRLAFFIRLSY